MAFEGGGETSMVTDMIVCELLLGADMASLGMLTVGTTWSEDGQCLHVM